MIRDIVEECQKRVHADMKEAINGAHPRYKLVFHAYVGENNGQMIRTASRCLWDTDTDNCASASWTNVRPRPMPGPAHGPPDPYHSTIACSPVCRRAESTRSPWHSRYTTSEFRARGVRTCAD